MQETAPGQASGDDSPGRSGDLTNAATTAPWSAVIRWSSGLPSARSPRQEDATFAGCCGWPRYPDHVRAGRSVEHSAHWCSRWKLKVKEYVADGLAATLGGSWMEDCPMTSTLSGWSKLRHRPSASVLYAGSLAAAVAHTRGASKRTLSLSRRAEAARPVLVSIGQWTYTVTRTHRDPPT